MEIVYQESISVRDYSALRAAVGWQPLCDDQVREGLEHSAYVVSCHAGRQIVGQARVIWDRGYIAYLADVMVMPQFQGQGIGRRLVELAKDYIRCQLRPGWKIKMVLVATKGREPFYEKQGFRLRPNEDSGAGMDLWIKA